MNIILAIVALFILILVVFNSKFDESKDGTIYKQSSSTDWIKDRGFFKSKNRKFLSSLTRSVYSKKAKIPKDIKNMSKCNIKKIILNKGDSLFIPAGWWSYTVSMNRNITIANYFLPYHSGNITKSSWRKKIPQHEIIQTDYNQLTKELFSTYIQKSQPLLIKQSLKDWYIDKRWTDSYLLSNISNMEIKYQKFPKNREKNQFTNQKGQNTREETLEGPFYNFLNLLKTDTQNNYYILNNYQIAKRLCQEFEIFKFTDGLKYAYSSFSMNMGSVNTPLHYDQFDVILNQVDGYKEIFLISPSVPLTFE